MTIARVPTVVGPVAGASPPWGAPDVDLEALGYVLEEFHLEGRLVGCQLAAGTEPTVDGRWQVEEFGDAPYRTRILVMRPLDPARFNGTVVACWQNVSAGYESRAPKDGEMFEGYAWVGISAQEVGIHGFPAGLERFAGRGARPLVEQDPQRYGELHHPGDPGAFDLFTQAVRAIGPERAGAVDPLGGLDVRRIIAMGGSQSAMRLVAYLNGVHPNVRVADAFLLSVWEGRAPRPEERAMPFGGRTSIRTDTGTPVLVVNSEFEAPHLAQIPITDTDDLRVWEVAGTAHGVARAGGDQPDARGRVVNRLTYRPVHEAGLRALQRWLVDGAAAPAQRRIEFDAGGRPTIARDDLGNARGGIRLPELEVPTHEYRGAAFGTGRAPLFGSARPFTPELLRELYPDRATYEGRWGAAVDALVASGTLRPEDAPVMRARAAEIELPLD